MSGFRVKARPTGAEAQLGRHGGPTVVSATGGSFELVAAGSQPGFNPVDLLYASLSACMVLSARIAASQLGVLDSFTGAVARVSGEKAGEPSRVASMSVVLEISGDFDADTRQAIGRMAEEICTISNTLHTSPDIRVDIR
ncbi:OsmC family protein [Rhizobium sp. LjRoot30]|uniref:OsmC family protein n=1 Tax=Rhizobium sp. LjRoot30 TaxID=3342320 RepID=UPI003ECEFE8F